MWRGHRAAVERLRGLVGNHGPFLLAWVSVLSCGGLAPGQVVSYWGADLAESCFSQKKDRRCKLGHFAWVSHRVSIEANRFLAAVFFKEPAQHLQTLVRLLLSSDNAFCCLPCNASFVGCLLIVCLLIVC